ncbi:MAG: ECF-type sigma factor [Acidobacteriota bacterium]|nr:ECF-type sigma factor [Acidobacteriota bacterium]
MEEREQGLEPDEDQLDDLLRSWQEGDDSAYDRLFELLHEDLRKLAHYQFAHERPNHTLQTGDLVSKLYLKLRNAQGANWKDHEHFRNSAVRAMKQILIDHARGWGRRATGKDKIPMDDLEPERMREFQDKDGDLLHLLAIKQSIEKMARLDPMMARIAYMKLVPGHSLQKIADEIDWDVNKVKREWKIIQKFVEPVVR